MTMEKFSSAQKCVNDHISLCRVEKQKTPPGRGFFQGLRLVTAEHTVLRQRKKYTRSGTNAQFKARILTFLSMDRFADFVHKILFMHTVFIYTVNVRSARGGRCFTGASKSWLKRVVPSAP
ncbi:hypothetical protein JGC44_13360 [Salmonella enterica subsp. enterica serovar Derby]|nr:hypothetical protein [Citrobacter freundii]MBJ3559195.1 hypothetical protein [Salmonella enterica subsp. enterica serovar Derby]